MSRRVSATHARVHFGELLREVTENGDTVVVEKSGKPAAVILSVEEYQALSRQNDDRQDWWELVERSRAAFRPTAERGRIPDAAELITLLREERDDQLLAALPRR